MCSKTFRRVLRGHTSKVQVSQGVALTRGHVDQGKELSSSLGCLESPSPGSLQTLFSHSCLGSSATMNNSRRVQRTDHSKESTRKRILFVTVLRRSLGSKTGKGPLLENEEPRHSKLLAASWTWKLLMRKRGDGFTHNNGLL